MQNAETKSPGFLDRAFITFLKLDGEKIVWIVLVLIALLSRTIMLGERAMSHDESLHTVYSLQLFDGRGYQHQPMMHGPLKFILNPVMYFLFGVNDWSARIQVAIFGVGDGGGRVGHAPLAGPHRRVPHRGDVHHLACAALPQPLHP